MDKLLISSAILALFCAVVVSSGSIKFKTSYYTYNDSSIDLKCDIETDDEDKILWYKKPDYARIGSGAVLPIAANTTCSDLGAYECVVVTYAGIKRQKIKLRLGNSSALSCNFTSNFTRPDRKILNTSETDRKWYNSRRDITLLVRKVDEPHPYYKMARLRIHKKIMDNCVEDLFSQLRKHCNISGNLTRVVRNNEVVVLSPQDVVDLKDRDKLEIYYEGAGRPTRMKTAMASSNFIKTFVEKMMKAKSKFRRGGMRKRNETDEAPIDAIVTPDWEEMYPVEDEMEEEEPPRRKGGRGRGRDGKGRRGRKDKDKRKQEEEDDEQFFF